MFILNKFLFYIMRKMILPREKKHTKENFMNFTDVSWFYDTFDA